MGACDSHIGLDAGLASCSQSAGAKIPIRRGWARLAQNLQSQVTAIGRSRPSTLDPRLTFTGPCWPKRRLATPEPPYDIAKNRR